jgi:hypothetical protein
VGDLSSIGKLLFVGGLMLAGVGLVLIIAPRVPGLSRLGHLPGDISFERGPVTIFIPLVSSLLISVLLTVILNLFLRR